MGCSLVFPPSVLFCYQLSLPENSLDHACISYCVKASLTDPLDVCCVEEVISVQIAPVPVCLIKRQGIWLRYLVVQWRLPWNHPCSVLSLIMPTSSKLHFHILTAVPSNKDVSACSYCPQNILSKCCIGFNYDYIRSYIMAISWCFYLGTNIPFPNDGITFNTENVLIVYIYNIYIYMSSISSALPAW